MALFVTIKSVCSTQNIKYLLMLHRGVGFDFGFPITTKNRVLSLKSRGDTSPVARVLSSGRMDPCSRIQVLSPWAALIELGNSVSLRMSSGYRADRKMALGVMVGWIK